MKLSRHLNRVVRSALWRTGIGKNTAKIFWKKVDSGEGFEYLYYGKKNVFDNLTFAFENPQLNGFMAEQSKKWSVQEEYVLKIKDVLVEPERCLGVRKFNELVEQTVVYKHDYQYPYIIPYLLKKRKAKAIKEAILYDGSATRNYYHHFVNAVNSLSVLSKVDVPRGIPFLINKTSFENKFFQYLYKNSEEFRQLNWLVLKKQDWVRVETLYKLQCVHFGKEPWQFTKRLYNLKNAVPFRKVFLSRDSNLFSRSLANEEEIRRMLAAQGFETVYAEHLTIEEQTKLFQETKYLVALSGMGLVQQFFLDYAKAHILEILPADRLMPEYYWQAHSLGIHYYDILVGNRMNNKGRYYLNEDLLKRCVEKMMNQSARS